jgi:hypothetical protein
VIEGFLVIQEKSWKNEERPDADPGLFLEK